MLLFWLEVMSVARCLDVAVDAMEGASKSLSVINSTSLLLFNANTESV
jgi:hypothetical protein